MGKELPTLQNSPQTRPNLQDHPFLWRYSFNSCERLTFKTRKPNLEKAKSVAIFRLGTQQPVLVAAGARRCEDVIDLDVVPFTSLLLKIHFLHYLEKKTIALKLSKIYCSKIICIYHPSCLCLQSSNESYFGNKLLL